MADGNCIGGTFQRAFPTSDTEIGKSFFFDPDRLIKWQGQVGGDGTEPDTGTEFLHHEQTVAAYLAKSRRNSSRGKGNLTLTVNMATASHPRERMNRAAVNAVVAAFR